MKYIILVMAAFFATSCAHDQSGEWDGIQREEEIERQEAEQKEEAIRTGQSDDLGPSPYAEP